MTVRRRVRCAGRGLALWLGAACLGVAFLCAGPLSGRAGASTRSGGGAGSGGGGGSAPRAALIHLRCRSSLDPSERRVSVVSVMRPVAHTRTLSVRFSLLEKPPGAAVRTVDDGDLGHWLTPADPTLGRRPADVWKLVKIVYGVHAPARYRFRVQFRWLGQDGRVLARARRTTSSCAVRERRPDVLVRGVSVHPIAGRPSRDRYIALIANRGRTASGPFSVLFAPGATGSPKTVAVRSLRSGAIVRVGFSGPACHPTAPPTVVADPGDAVEDFDRANNTLTVSCPSASGGWSGAWAEARSGAGAGD